MLELQLFIDFLALGQNVELWLRSLAALGRDDAAVMAQDEVPQHRVGHFTPAATAENAVVAGALDFVIELFTLGYAAAHVQRCLGLADAGDVVQLALDGHDRCLGNVLRAHALDVAVHTLHVPGAVDQLEFLEHGLDGVEVVLGIHVEHGVVFVVELAVRFGAFAVAANQILEVIVVAGGVAVGVHGHEAGKLQEARIHATAFTRIAGRHAVDHVVLEPLDAALHGQVVHGGRRFAGIDRTAHHGHGGRCLLAARSHQGDGRQHRHRRLAHAHHMAFAVFLLQVADEFLHVVDVVVEVEAAFGQRHLARVLPVGDVDLVVFQHGADGVTQQGGVVAGERGNDQYDRVAQHLFQRFGIVGIALETAQLAEGLVDLDALMDGDWDAIHFYRFDLEAGLFIVLGQTVQQVVASGHAVGARGVAERKHGIGEHAGRRQGEFRERFHQRALCLVDLVKHGQPSGEKCCGATILAVIMKYVLSDSIAVRCRCSNVTFCDSGHDAQHSGNPSFWHGHARNPPVLSWSFHQIAIDITVGIFHASWCASVPCSANKKATGLAGSGFSAMASARRLTAPWRCFRRRSRCSCC